jgi:RNA polymerase sigma-70 factor (ECF subfamily)
MMKEGRGRSPVDSSFDELYRREIGSLRTLAAGLTGNRELAADLAHEAMLRAYRDWGKVGSLDRPGAWVRRVLINLATDTHRRRAREVSALERLPPTGAAAAADPVDDEFWRALRALPDLQRNAAVLFYVDDLSVERIAEILQVAAGTVKKGLFNARKNLAQSLGTDDLEVMS